MKTGRGDADWLVLVAGFVAVLATGFVHPEPETDAMETRTARALKALTGCEAARACSGEVTE